MELEDREPREPKPELEPPIEGQTSLLSLICICSEDCEADVDQHVPECPVEQKLRRTFGF